MSAPRTDEQRAAHAAYMKQWRAANPASVQQRNRDNHAAWYVANRAERIAANKRWRLENPDFAAEMMRAQSRRRRLGYNQESADYAALVLDDPCCYCGAPSEHTDHIEPLASGGSNAWDNLTGACADCNRRKRDHPLLHWLPYRSQ